MKERLLTSAQNLDKVSEAAGKEFSSRAGEMAAQCSRVIADRPDLEKLIGDRKNLDMAVDNNRNFARFMDAMFSDFNADVLVETVIWVFRTYRAHGFNTTYWAANLNIWADTLESELSPETFQAVSPYYEWLIVNIPLFVKLTDLPAEPGDEEAGHAH